MDDYDLELDARHEEKMAKDSAIQELRMCVADLRQSLTDCLESLPFDPAQILNDTMDVARKHKCYRSLSPTGVNAPL